MRLPQAGRRQGHARAVPQYLRRGIPADVHGGGGSDAARHGNPCGRGLARRAARYVLDHGRVPARLRDCRADIRAARRLARPAQHAAGGARRVRARLFCLQRCPVLAAARRGARAPGGRRRRTDGAVPVHRRRTGTADRARPVPGLFRDDVHRRQRQRPGGRRNRGLAFQLALAVPRQPAVRRVRGVAAVPAAGGRAPSARRGLRCAGPCVVRHRRGCRAVLAHLRRAPLRLGLDAKPCAAGGCGGGACGPLLA